MKCSYLAGLLIVAVSLPSCTDSSAQTPRSASSGWDAACATGSGGVQTDVADIVFGSQGDAHSVEFTFVALGRDIGGESPEYRPEAFQNPGEKGIRGGSMGRWSVGLDSDGTLWLHDDAYSLGNANVFLVEPAEAPDSGLVLVEALTRDLRFDLGPCGGLDSLTALLNAERVVTEFLGGEIIPR